MPMLTMGTRKPAQPLMNMAPRKPMQNAGNQITALGGGVKPSPYAPSFSAPVNPNPISIGKPSGMTPGMTPGWNPNGGYNGPPQTTGPVNRPDDPRNKPIGDKPDVPEFPPRIMPGNNPILTAGGGGTFGDAPMINNMGGMNNMQSSLGGPSPDMMSQLLRRLMAGRG